MSNTDWDTVTVLRKKAPNKAVMKSEAAVNKARRDGTQIETQQKFGAATNKQHVTTKNTAKLDRETEELRHDKVPLDTAKLIMQARQAKGISQKDLATVCGLNNRHRIPTIICITLRFCLENLRKNPTGD